ncbi:MAG: type II secretion system F family protein [Gammaproteobacteria bacterium]|nr:type II secretion system F family protein [Gammaproteobacteria bacterium]
MIEKHLFLIRQVANMVEQGHSIESALSQIKELSESQVWDKVYDQYQLTGDIKQALKQIPGFHFTHVASQLNQAADAGIAQEEVLAKASNTQSRSIQMASLLKGRLMRSASYAAIIGVIALIVTAMFAIYVAPMFGDLFSEYPDESSQLSSRLEGLMLQSWLSVIYYLPPLILIGLFVFFSLTPTDKLLFNRAHRKLPLLRGMQIQLARSYFINNIYEYRESVANSSENVLSNSFFTTENYNLDQLLRKSEIDKLNAIFELGTQEKELPIMLTEIETETIESANKKTSGLSTLLLILMFMIVANLVYTIYLPIFKLGAVF